jgi:RNA polymerase sigma-70 factor (ECF subfamily)
MRGMETTHHGNDYLVRLLAEVSGGNDSAFSELHRLTSAYLYRFALRMLQRPFQAEEVLQEAYLSVWTHASRFRPAAGSAMTWLITIVRNHSLDILRSEKLERECTVDSAADAAWLEEAGAAFADREEADDAAARPFLAVERRRLRECVAELEPVLRQSVVLAFDHGMTHAELAVHLGAPLGTVKSWVRRGLERLRKKLEYGRAPMYRLSPSSAR